MEIGFWDLEVPLRSSGAIEKRSVLHRSYSVRNSGAFGSENGGMSNFNPAENAGHRKPKVSPATIFDGGLAGPKARPKGVVDGQQVNIPALQQYRPSETGARIFFNPIPDLSGCGENSTQVKVELAGG